MTKRIKLKLDQYFYVCGRERSDMLLCSAVTGKYFDLPREVQTFTLCIASRKPSTRDFYEVKSEGDSYTKLLLASPRRRSSLTMNRYVLRPNGEGEWQEAPRLAFGLEARLYMYGIAPGTGSSAYVWIELEEGCHE